MSETERLREALRDLIWIESSDGSGWFCETCLTHKRYAGERVPHDPDCRYIAAEFALLDTTQTADAATLRASVEALPWFSLTTLSTRTPDQMFVSRAAVLALLQEARAATRAVPPEPASPEAT